LPEKCNDKSDFDPLHEYVMMIFYGQTTAAPQKKINKIASGQLNTYREVQ
jgi:hypothetical protein